MTRPLRPLTALALLWLTSSAAMLHGCNLFEPRTPEAPTVPPVHVSYTGIDSTLDTMNRALQAKTSSNALSAWLDALATDRDGLPFQATFDLVVLQQWVGRPPPAVWTVSNERTFYPKFVSEVAPEASSYELTWDTDQEHPNNETSEGGTGYSQKVVTHKHYLVTAYFEDGSSETVAVGYADLTFILSKIGNRWVIAQWADRVDPLVGPNPGNKNLASFSQRRLDSL